MRNKPIKAFTLVELMIVLAIIGIVVALSLFSLTKSREGARDAKRKTDLENVRSALELYKADNGGYPKTGVGTTTTFYNLNNISTALVGTGGSSYIAAIPQDPRYNGSAIFCDTTSNNYRYEYASDATKYILRARMENQTESKCVDWTGCLKVNWPTCYMVTQP